jgi:hypothetical protein
MRKLKSVALIAFTVGCALAAAACAPSTPSTAAQSAFDQYVGKTCTGIINHDKVDVTGYMARGIPVVAKFFRTSDGRPGVSFKYANRAFFYYTSFRTERRWTDVHRGSRKSVDVRLREPQSSLGARHLLHRCGSCVFGRGIFLHLTAPPA